MQRLHAWWLGVIRGRSLQKSDVSNKQTTPGDEAPAVDAPAVEAGEVVPAAGEIMEKPSYEKKPPATKPVAPFAPVAEVVRKKPSVADVVEPMVGDAVDGYEFERGPKYTNDTIGQAYSTNEHSSIIRIMVCQKKLQGSVQGEATESLTRCGMIATDKRLAIRLTLRSKCSATLFPVVSSYVG